MNDPLLFNEVWTCTDEIEDAVLPYQWRTLSISKLHNWELPLALEGAEPTRRRQGRHHFRIYAFSGAFYINRLISTKIVRYGSFINKKN